MLCDRTNTKIPDAQIFFIGFFVEDIIKSFHIRCPNFKILLDIAKENKEKWSELKVLPYILEEFS